jgi:ATP-dependent DNA helicase RecG
MGRIPAEEPTVQFSEVAQIFIAAFNRPSYDELDKTTDVAATPKEPERTTGESTGKSSGKRSGKTEEQIISLLSVNGKLTIPELADTLGITTRAVEKQIARLRGQGRLRRVGPAKGGHWEVVK